MSGQRWFKEHSEEREQRHTGEQAHGGSGRPPSPRQDPGTVVRVHGCREVGPCPGKNLALTLSHQVCHMTRDPT